MEYVGAIFDHLVQGGDLPIEVSLTRGHSVEHLESAHEGAGRHLVDGQLAIPRMGLEVREIGIEASAQALALAFMIFLMTLIYFWLQRRWVVYQ